MAQRRSIILNDMTTSVSMEEVFWQELDRLAEERGLAWQEFLREILRGNPTPANRAAAVKEAILYCLKRESGEVGPVMTTWWDVTSPMESCVSATYGYRVIVGREERCELVIHNREVSRAHSMLVWDNHHWWVVDLKSKNGTIVNGKRIEVAQLRINQSFRVGECEVRMLRHD